MSNEEDRGTPSFDDLFEHPDAEPVSVTPKVATPDPIPRDANAGWTDDLDLPDFVTPAAANPSELRPPQSEPPEPSPPEWEMSNVNVIGAVSARPELRDEPIEEPAVVEAAFDEPEFVPPLDAFATGGQGASTSTPAGRLYRSSGAEGPSAAAAIPALESVGATPSPIRVSTDPRTSAAASAAEPDPTASPRTAAMMADSSGTDPAYADSRSPRRSLRPSNHPAGLTYNGAAVVILAATILVGFIDALLNHRLGWLTGVALIASSVYAALNVRITDAWAPAILAPLGFMAATLTAGQLTLGASGSWFVREGYMIFRSLAVNAPWIIGATVICAVIAFWRRRQNSDN